MEDNIKINKLISKTWYWLNMNETDVTLKDLPYKMCRNTSEICADGVSYNSNNENDKCEIESGMGKDIDKMMKGYNVYSDSIYIEPDKELSEPLRISFNYDEKKKYFNCIEIHAGENSKATIIMDYTSAKEIEGIAAVQTKIYAQKNAEIRIVQVQLTGENFMHLNDIGGKCDEGASIEIYQFMLGGRERYSGCRVDLCGAESKVNEHIGYIGINEQKLDMNYIVNHKGAKTESQINVTGVLNDEASKMFRGTIDFKQGAAGAVGNENEEVLMIGENSHNMTIPIILCAEEDVEGNHGATIGKLDDEVLFYLSTRGINRDEAYYMISKAKINDLCRRVDDAEVTNKVQEYIGCLEEK